MCLSELPRGLHLTLRFTLRLSQFRCDPQLRLPLDLDFSLRIGIHCDLRACSARKLLGPASFILVRTGLTKIGACRSNLRVRSPRERGPGSLCQVRGMHPNHSKLESRVHRAAEAALSRQKYVSAIDVLCGMGLLTSAHVDDWRKGRVDFLERVVQGNLKKISSSMAIFRRWATEKGLSPAKADTYVSRGAALWPCNSPRAETRGSKELPNALRIACALGKAAAAA